ncbi:tetratricopeptide repeat-containing glycosyltransferase family 2 protein [Wukongibacter sp. M2B1]|uniref:tetratricopeptide repeat-containing glycosyltransferase family 2 protein n=1 Tax=Wukongibacter sp. M2B1 TaxID=3088895 RepID=UPI003D7949DC
MKKSKSVSLCMIVKNEEKHLERCLNSVKGLVDEIIIVDTGSIDNTKKIAEKFGAIIKDYEWDNNFSNARNYSLEFAKMEWILLLDGDDEFNSEYKKQYIDLINNSAKDGHYFKTLSFTGDIINKDNVVSNLNLRLLKNNNKYKFVGAIHEQIRCLDGTMDYRNFASEDIEIFHYGYLTEVAIEKEKRKRNIAIIEEELKRDPTNQFHIFNLANEYFALNDLNKTLELFDKVYKNLNPNTGYSSKLVIRRIMCLDELNRYNDALNAIQEGLKMYPEFTDLEFIRGLIHLKGRRYTLAIKSFEKCVEMGMAPIQLEFIRGAGTFRPHMALGGIYYKFEDYQNSLSSYEKALQFNPTLKSPVYKIGSILNKVYDDKKFVSYNLSKYFSLDYEPNLLMISDILMNEGLYDMASGYLEKAKDTNKENKVIDLQIGKCLFYQKKYSDALEIFKKLEENNEIAVECKKFLFIINLISHFNNLGLSELKIDENKDFVIDRIYGQFHNILIGNNEVLLLEKDDHEKILHISLDLLGELLKVNEFYLFEKLINILNLIESKNILLELAKLYKRHGFNSMAAQEVIRSIQEFGVVDVQGAEILYSETN